MHTKRHTDIKTVIVKPSTYVKILLGILSSTIGGRHFSIKWAKPIRKLELEGLWPWVIQDVWLQRVTMWAFCEHVGREMHQPARSGATGNTFKGNQMTMSKGLFHPCCQ